MRSIYCSSFATFVTAMPSAYPIICTTFGIVRRWIPSYNMFHRRGSYLLALSDIMSIVERLLRKPYCLSDRRFYLHELGSLVRFWFQKISSLRHLLNISVTYWVLRFLAILNALFGMPYKPGALHYQNAGMLALHHGYLVVEKPRALSYYRWFGMCVCVCCTL